MTKRVLSIAVAALSAQIGSPDLLQLMPDGQFASIDGRPDDVPGGKWLMDQQAADMLLAAAKARTNDFVIDYEHQTLYSEKNGQPALAAGWVSPTALEYRPGEGFFARLPRWTRRAKGFIADEEYKYISPVFEYDRTTGRPTRLRHIALINDAGVDGMNAVVAALKSLSAPSTDHEEDSSMNELLKKLLAALGIEIPDADIGDEAKLKAAVDKAVAAAGEMTKTTGDAVKQVAALKAQVEKPDPLKFVSIGVVDALREELAALKAGADVESVDRLIADAREEGRLFASEESWARDLAERHGVAALKANLDKRPTVAALKGRQTHDSDKNRGGGGNALTEAQLAVCKATGIDPKDYAATLAAS